MKANSFSNAFSAAGNYGNAKADQQASQLYQQKVRSQLGQILDPDKNRVPNSGLDADLGNALQALQFQKQQTAEFGMNFNALGNAMLNQGVDLVPFVSTN